MLGAQSFYFYHGHFLRAQSKFPHQVSKWLWMFTVGAEEPFSPFSQRVLLLSPFGCPFLRTSLYSLRTHSPGVFSPKTHDFECTHRPKQNNVKYWHPDPVVSTSLQCGHTQTEIRLEEAHFWGESCYSEHRTLTSVIKASQNCYSNKNI